MPQSPNRICRKPSCPNLTRHPSGYCTDHQGEAQHREQARRREYGRRTDQERGTAHERGYTGTWQRYRIAFLHKHPYCGDSPDAERTKAFGCGSKGIVRAATIVDHIIPAADAPEKFWDEMNHQSLCRGCHAIKTALDIRARRTALATR